MASAPPPPPDYVTAVAQKLRYWSELQSSTASSNSSSSGSNGEDLQQQPPLPPPLNPDYVPDQQERHESNIRSHSTGSFPETEPPSSSRSRSFPSTWSSSEYSNPFIMSSESSNRPVDAERPRKRRFSYQGASRKTAKLARTASIKMKQFEEKHKVADKTKELVRQTSLKFKELMKKPRRDGTSASPAVGTASNPTYAPRIY